MSAGEGKVADELVSFLNSSPTSFHAVATCKSMLSQAGFEQIHEKEPWSLEAGGKYYFTRNHSSITAFCIGQKYKAGNGFLVLGAHTDSPCLKVKAVSKAKKGAYLGVGVETYGGGLWHTWFDRDLTLAGRVFLRAGARDFGADEPSRKKAKTSAQAHEGKPGVTQRLVHIARPILRIPNLAIHLDRSVNESGFKPNTQTQLLPIIATQVKASLECPAPDVAGAGSAAGSAAATAPAAAAAGAPGEGAGADSLSASARHHPILMKLLADELGCAVDQIVDFELQVCDAQPSVIGGAAREFIFSGRLDNLCMSFVCTKSLLDSCSSLGDESMVRVVSLFDHEECGSNSAHGAAAPLLKDLIARVTEAFGKGHGVQQDFQMAVARSFLVSADMAHAVHPNYPEKHEENHQPQIHKGLVLKHNANQRYATNARTALLLREVARPLGIPVQEFHVRNDSPCGSTIGPILASSVGIRTVDLGVPQLSMHSIREICGTDDVEHAFKHLKALFEFRDIDAFLDVDGP
eukprot:jgi/Mesvir1/8681/Mv02620-RA.1